MTEELKNLVRNYLQKAQESYENKERYTRLAFNSGGSEEIRYKKLRNEQSDLYNEYLEKADEAMLQLQDQGIESRVLQDGVTVEFYRRK